MNRALIPLLVTLWVGLSPSPSFCDTPLKQEAKEALKAPLPPKPGEICIVCRYPLQKDDPVIRLRGRRVPLKRGVIDTFLEDPERYFEELQPKGALFSEKVDEAPTSNSWLIFGFVCLLGVILGAARYICKLREEAKEASVLKGLKIPATSTPDNCAGCGASLHPTVSKCPDCGHIHTPTYQSEVERIVK